MSLLAAVLSKLQTTSTVVNDIYAAVISPVPASSVIKTIQQGSVSATAVGTAGSWSSGSGTAGISSVNTSKAFVIWNGASISGGGGAGITSSVSTRATLNSSTQVGGSISVFNHTGPSAVSATIYFTVVEYN